jgi:hypothetical protein
VSYERLAVWREDGKSMEGSSKISALARASSMQLSAVYFMALEAIPKPEQGFDGSVLRLAALVHLEVVDPRVDLAVVDVIAEVVHRAALLGVLGLVAAADVGGDGPLTEHRCALSPGKSSLSQCRMSPERAETTLATKTHLLAKPRTLAFSS